MSRFPRKLKMPLLGRRNVAQNLRLTSGLILFVFAGTHFINHALGLVQLEAMYDFQQWRWMVTRSIPGSLLLAAALITHAGLGLIKLANRSTLRLPAWELVQIGLGLAIPVLLLPHVVDTRIASSSFGVSDTYLYTLARLWPAGAVTQSVLLLLVWGHGCLGIHYWLRLRRHYQLVQPVLLVIAIIIPIAALAGFMVSGRAVTLTMADGEMAERIKGVTHWPSPSAEDSLAAYRLAVRVGFLLVILVVAGYMAARHFLMLAAPKIVVSYAGGPSVRTPVGPTLLEISRANGIAHLAACGGRARCTTCRVFVEQGGDGLQPPASPEAAALATIEAPKDTRLACQLRPQASLTVRQLLRAPAAERLAAAEDETEAAGTEKSVTVLCVGMTDSGEVLHGRLAYDVVFILNEFFATVGAVIAGHQGRIDKVFGHILLAVFGEQQDLQAGCKQALRAAHAIDGAMDRLNEKMSAEIGRPIKCAIGIHAGKVVLGRIGYGGTKELTALGTVVDTSAGLQALAERSSHQIMLSSDVARIAGLPETAAARTITLRAGEGNNGGQPLQAFAIARGRDLPAEKLV